MADLVPVLEMLEHRYMRAWGRGDAKELKSLTAASFRLVVASKPSMLLDSISWVDAARGRWRLNSFHFGDSVFARGWGRKAGVIAARVTLDMTMDGVDWSGDYWLTDVWRKSAVRGRWQLNERILSAPVDGRLEAGAIRALQQWR